MYSIETNGPFAIDFLEILKLYINIKDNPQVKTLTLEPFVKTRNVKSDMINYI